MCGAFVSRGFFWIRSDPVIMLKSTARPPLPCHVSSVALGGATLETWQGGVALAFDFNMITGSPQTQKTLAKQALTHL